MSAKGSYRLQFLFRGQQIAPTITFTLKQLDDHGLISSELVELLLSAGKVEYELGRYKETTREGVLSGATMEEASRAVEYLATFYQLEQQHSGALLLEEERQYKLANDRLKRIVLLLTEVIGATKMNNLWLRMLVNQINGMSREEMAQVLGERLSPIK